MTKKTKRMVTDAILSILIVLAMFIQITGAVLHEIIGAVFFAILVAHLALSFKWIKGTSKQAKKRSLSKRNKALVVMALLLVEVRALQALFRQAKRAVHQALQVRQVQELSLVPQRALRQLLKSVRFVKRDVL